MLPGPAIPKELLLPCGPSFSRLLVHRGESGCDRSPVTPRWAWKWESEVAQSAAMKRRKSSRLRLGSKLIAPLVQPSETCSPGEERMQMLVAGATVMMV